MAEAQVPVFDSQNIYDLYTGSTTTTTTETCAIHNLFYLDGEIHLYWNIHEVIDFKVKSMLTA